MTDTQHIQILLDRLWRACCRFNDYGLSQELYPRGIEVIGRNHGVIIYLSDFRPAGPEYEGCPDKCCLEIKMTNITLVPRR